MAKADVAENVTPVEDADWETVVEESGTGISFENVGDQFIGVFLGTETIAPDGWDEKDFFLQHKFRDSEGDIRTLNGGYKLNDAMEKVDVGKTVRITRTPDVEMSDPGKNAMKDYRVETAR